MKEKAKNKYFIRNEKAKNKYFFGNEIAKNKYFFGIEKKIVQVIKLGKYLFSLNYFKKYISFLLIIKKNIFSFPNCLINHNFFLENIKKSNENIGVKVINNNRRSNLFQFYTLYRRFFLVRGENLCSGNIVLFGK